MADESSAPFDLQAEQAVLGAALLDPAAADECVPLLAPEAMYREAHRRIWRAIRTLRASHTPCDVITVAETLQRDDALESAGGLGYLSDLVASVPATANATHYAQILLRHHVRREALAAARDIAEAARQSAATSDDLMAALSVAQRRILDAASAGRQWSTYRDHAMGVFAEIEQIHEGTIPPGIATGLPGFDERLGGGLHRGELLILAARPGEGKSQLAQFMAHAQVDLGYRVAFASAEMRKDDLTRRALALESDVNSMRLRGQPRMRDQDWPGLSHGLARISEMTLWIDDGFRSMEQVCGRVRQLHAHEPIDVVYIDHLHHLQPPAGIEKRGDALGDMTRMAKDLAVDLDCAVVLLAQLNRESLKEQRPQLHNIRDSGYVEMLADVVVFLWHEPSKNGEAAATMRAELLTAKQRYGRGGVHPVVHHKPTGRFREVSKETAGSGQESADAG